jgi:hypothetical protein
LEVIRSDAHNYAYHCLKQNKKEVKRVFIFATPAQPTLHDLRLASQVYLADGLALRVLRKRSACMLVIRC